MDVFSELKQRGLIAQMTHEEEIKELLQKEKVTFYIGFDPTADSLHVGHFLQMIVMSHLQKAGHTPIALIGGGTAMVGDPSGRTDMRQMLTNEQLDYNVSCFKKQMEKFIDFSDNKAIMVNNADWLLNLNYIEFLREVGVYYSVNQMLTAECFKSRLEKGLTFIEFNYMLMQGYDFYYLNQKYNCKMQLGGDDQWSNILGGINLTRRKASKQVYGMTFNLLVTSEGKKMGKTQSGAVWLDPKKTSPYDFYQYWRNIDDNDVIKCLKMLTFLPLDYIETLSKLEGSELNQAKEILAYELTALVHSKDAAQEAQGAARALFSNAGDSENMPSFELNTSEFSDNSISVLDVLVLSSLAPSKTEARRLITQGGVVINDKKVEKIDFLINIDDFNNGYVIIKKGKKTFMKITLKK